MPTEVYDRLSEEKRGRIYDVLLDEFSRKPLSEVNVKTIVERLGIARGSFYQYFDDLADSYFAVLDKETVDIHSLFMTVLRQSGGDVALALDRFGEEAARVLFRDPAYMVYKNRYLYWTPELDAAWQQYRWNAARHNPEQQKLITLQQQMNDDERIHFLKAVVHSLIQRLFRENWDEECFLAHYRQHIQWIKKGVTL